MVLATNLLVLTGCASTSTLDWLRTEHAEAIAEDLAIAVAARLPLDEATVFIAEMPLRDHFESAIREQGFAIAAIPDDAIQITGLGERIPPNTWHVGLAVDDGIRVHRLYRIDQDDVHALSSISVGNHPSEETTREMTNLTSWHLRALHTPRPANPRLVRTPKDEPAILQPASNEAAFETDPPFEAPELALPVTAPNPVATNVSGCPSTDGAVLTFPIGSLKRGLVEALSRCGWRVTAWPNDARNLHLIVDWVVTRETSVKVTSVEDLLAGLRATYGLNATIDEDNREIAFSMERES